MINSAEVLFYILGLMTLIAGVGVVAMQNPIYSALCLVMTMIGISGLFFTLEAYFVAGVQLIVYAGAVTVLFVMVVMLFDLRKEVSSALGGGINTAAKAVGVGIILGLILSAISLSKLGTSTMPLKGLGASSIKEVAVQLFTKYIFGFEIISVLLLLVVVGAVGLARSRGGTHA